MPFGTAIRDAAQQATAGHAPPEPGARNSSKWADEDARMRGAAEAPRLAQLPYGWQVDGVRRAALGREKLSAASAAMAINTLRAYGMDPRHAIPGHSMTPFQPAGVRRDR